MMRLNIEDASNEVRGRLAEGQSAIGLSLEKWEAICDFVYEDGGPEWHEVALFARQISTCGLCVKHFCSCPDCPLYQDGHGCLDDHDSSSVYHRALCELDRCTIGVDCRKMRDILRGLYDAERQGTQP